MSTHAALVSRSSVSSRSSRNSGQTLIGLLVVIVIGIVLYMALLGRRKGPDGEERPSIATSSIDRGEGVALGSNIAQIQQFIVMYKGENDGKVPASLDELKSASKFPAEMFINPVDKKPLVYDPASGAIGVAPNSSVGVPGTPKIPIPGGGTLAN